MVESVLEVVLLSLELRDLKRLPFLLEEIQGAAEEVGLHARWGLLLANLVCVLEGLVQEYYPFVFHHLLLLFFLQSLHFLHLLLVIHFAYCHCSSSRHERHRTHGLVYLAGVVSMHRPAQIDLLTQIHSCPPIPMS